MSGQHKATLSHFATVHEYKAYCKGHEEASKELAAARALLQEVLDGTQPFISALECECDFDGEKWAEKARSFLEGE
jgi:hypothetical protein